MLIGQAMPKNEESLSQLSFPYAHVESIFSRVATEYTDSNITAYIYTQVAKNKYVFQKGIQFDQEQQILKPITSIENDFIKQVCRETFTCDGIVYFSSIRHNDQGFDGLSKYPTEENTDHEDGIGFLFPPYQQSSVKVVLCWWPIIRSCSENYCTILGALGSLLWHAETIIASRPALISTPAVVVRLSAREEEVMGWIVQGKTAWETGRILTISERTVKFHLRNIYSKFDVKNRPQAVARYLSQQQAILEGIVPPVHLGSG